MNAIHQIIDDAPDTIPVPVELRHRRVEVTFTPLDEKAKAPVETDEMGWPIGFFEATAGCLADDPIERAPQGDYEQRLELE